MTGTVPAIPQVPAGWAPVGADVTAWVTTPLAFLTSRVMFRGSLAAAQPVSGFTLMPLDTIAEDPYGGWSATSTGSQAAFSWLTPPGCSGWYEVTMTAMTTSPGNNTDQVQAVLYVNGSPWQQASADWGVNGHDTGSCGMSPVPLLGGVDYVQLYVFSQSAVNTPTAAGRHPSMEIAWVSA